jgi:hypothetical protein
LRQATTPLPPEPALQFILTRSINIYLKATAWRWPI